MQISKVLQNDQDGIKRFILTLSDASVEVRNNQRANHDFFLRVHEFITGYIDEGLFKKEELIIKALADGGFSTDQGPIAALLADKEKSLEMGGELLESIKRWQAGEAEDQQARMDIGWAAREYVAVMRQHMERLKTLIFPLVEQTLSQEEEDQISAAVSNLVFEGGLKGGAEKYLNMVNSIETDFKSWK
jgi:hemerythrin-like domain-containing protein